jgi:hypothetical protein
MHCWEEVSIEHTFYSSVLVLSEEQRLIGEREREREKGGERVGMVMFVRQTTVRHLSLLSKHYTIEK